MPQYYAWNAEKISLREHWQLRRSVGQFILARIGHMLGMTSAGSPRIRPESIQRIEQKELPEAILARFAQTIDEVERCGLRFGFFHRAPDNVLDRRDDSRAVTFIDPGEQFWAGLGWVRVGRGAVVTERWRFHCVTLCADGSFLETTNHRQRLHSAPIRKIECLPEAGPQTVVTAHRRRLTSLDPAQIVPINGDNLADCLLASAQANFDYLVARGLMIPI